MPTPVLERLALQAQRPLDRVPRQSQVARDRAGRLPVWPPPPADLADRLHVVVGNECNYSQGGAVE
jgi:hypothetical protein